jgi:hypothetical protein
MPNGSNAMARIQKKKIDKATQISPFKVETSRDSDRQIHPLIS